MTKKRREPPRGVARPGFRDALSQYRNAFSNQFIGNMTKGKPYIRYSLSCDVKIFAFGVIKTALTGFCAKPIKVRILWDSKPQK